MASSISNKFFMLQADTKLEFKKVKYLMIGLNSPWGEDLMDLSRISFVRQFKEIVAGQEMQQKFLLTF